MADESPTPAPQAGRRDGNRDGSRDGGGFRIRLSDNEMRAARSIQEAFRLRSTVAVLGFSVRTIAQLLDEGKLDELVAQQQAQAGTRRTTSRDAERGGRDTGRAARQDRQARIDPFARPARPTTLAEPAPESESPPEAPAAAEPGAAGDTTGEPNEEPSGDAALMESAGESVGESGDTTGAG